MNPTFRKGLALLLTFFYSTTQVALGSMAESNFWAERRGKNTKPTSTTQPMQLAALPNPLFTQMPSISATLPQPTKWGSLNKARSSHLSKNFQALVDAIPLNYGTIQDVYNPPPSPENDHGKASPVVLLQDVHLNTEAQTNIAGVLQELIDQKQVGLVGVEGAFSLFDFKPFRVFPNKEMTRAVAEDFLKKNLMAAPSLVGITSLVEPPAFVGVDDPAHYKANVDAYLTSRLLKDKVAKELNFEKQQILEAKKNVFSTALQRFDNLRNAHHKNDIGFGVYVKKISDLYSSLLEGEGRVGGAFVLNQFLEAYEMETTLNLPQVETERRTIIEKLSKTLNEKEISNLVAESLAYRMGRIGFGAYYQGLKDLCREKGVSLSQTPAFDNYIRYVLLSDGIKAEALFTAVSHLEDQIVAHLASTPEEKALVARSDHLALTEKLIDFSLTPPEWEKYRKAATGDLQLATGTELKPFESFYEQADIRSHKMLQNLLQVARNQSPAASLLILGGFHSPQVAHLLRAQKISYVIVSPKITKIDDTSGSSYLSVFAREKTPLDRLFAGEKLFLASADVAVGAVGIGSFTLVGDLLRSVLRFQIFGKPSKVTIEGSDVTLSPASDGGKGGIIFDKTRVILTHPITAVFTETAVLAMLNWIGLPMANDWLSIVVKLAVTIGVAVIFSVVHMVASGEKTRQAFFQHFFAGGILLIAPIVFIPALNGVLLSGALHLVWNGIYLIWKPIGMLPLSVPGETAEKMIARFEAAKKKGTAGYLEILGVKPNVSEREAERAYRQLVLSVHPDHYQGQANHANELFGLIHDMREAYYKERESGSSVTDDGSFFGGARTDDLETVIAAKRIKTSFFKLFSVSSRFIEIPSSFEYNPIWLYLTNGGIEIRGQGQFSIGTIMLDKNREITGLKFDHDMYPNMNHGTRFDDIFLEKRVKIIEQLSQQPFIAMYFLHQLNASRNYLGVIPANVRERLKLSFDVLGGTIMGGTVLGRYHPGYGIFVGLDGRFQYKDPDGEVTMSHEFQHFYGDLLGDTAKSFLAKVSETPEENNFSRFFSNFRSFFYGDSDWTHKDGFDDSLARLQQRFEDLIPEAKNRPAELILAVNAVKQIRDHTGKHVYDLLRGYYEKNQLFWSSFTHPYDLSPNEWLSNKAEYYLTLNEGSLFDLYRHAGMENEFLTPQDLAYFRSRYGEISYLRYQMLQAQAAGNQVAADSFKAKMSEMDPNNIVYAKPTLFDILKFVRSDVLHENLTRVAAALYHHDARSENQWSQSQRERRADFQPQRLVLPSGDDQDRPLLKKITACLHSLHDISVLETLLRFVDSHEEFTSEVDLALFSLESEIGEKWSWLRPLGQPLVRELLKSIQGREMINQRVEEIEKNIGNRLGISRENIALGVANLTVPGQLRLLLQIIDGEVSDPYKMGLGNEFQGLTRALESHVSAYKIGSPFFENFRALMRYGNVRESVEARLVELQKSFGERRGITRDNVVAALNSIGNEAAMELALALLDETAVHRNNDGASSDLYDAFRKQGRSFDRLDLWSEGKQLFEWANVRSVILERLRELSPALKKIDHVVNQLAIASERESTRLLSIAPSESVKGLLVQRRSLLIATHRNITETLREVRDLLPYHHEDLAKTLIENRLSAVVTQSHRARTEMINTDGSESLDLSVLAHVEKSAEGVISSLETPAIGRPNSIGYLLSLLNEDPIDVAVKKGWISMALEAVGLNAVNVLFLASTFSGNSSSPVIWWSALALQGAVLIAMAAYHAYLYRKLQIKYQTEPNRRNTVAGFFIHLFWFSPYLLPLLFPAVISTFAPLALPFTVPLFIVAMIVAVYVHVRYDASQMGTGERRDLSRVDSIFRQIAEINREIANRGGEAFWPAIKDNRDARVTAALRQKLQGVKNPEHVIEFEEKNGVIIGYILYRIEPTDSPMIPGAVYVDSLAVHPSHSGEGVGARLMKKAFQFARAHEARKVFLGTYKVNVKANKFYRNLPQRPEVVPFVESVELNPVLGRDYLNQFLYNVGSLPTPEPLGLQSPLTIIIAVMMPILELVLFVFLKNKAVHVYQTLSPWMNISLTIVSVTVIFAALHVLFTLIYIAAKATAHREIGGVRHQIRQILNEKGVRAELSWNAVGQRLLGGALLTGALYIPGALLGIKAATGKIVNVVAHSGWNVVAISTWGKEKGIRPLSLYPSGETSRDQLDKYLASLPNDQTGSPSKRDQTIRVIVAYWSLKNGGTIPELTAILDGNTEQNREDAFNYFCAHVPTEDVLDTMVIGMNKYNFIIQARVIEHLIEAAVAPTTTIDAVAVVLVKVAKKNKMDLIVFISDLINLLPDQQIQRTISATLKEVGHSGTSNEFVRRYGKYLNRRLVETFKWDIDNIFMYFEMSVLSDFSKSNDPASNDEKYQLAERLYVQLKAILPALPRDLRRRFYDYEPLHTVSRSVRATIVDGLEELRRYHDQMHEQGDSLAAQKADTVYREESTKTMNPSQLLNLIQRLEGLHPSMDLNVIEKMRAEWQRFELLQEDHNRPSCCGQILWVRSLVMWLSEQFAGKPIASDEYKRRLVTIENSLSLVLAIVFLASMGTGWGNPLQSIRLIFNAALGIFVLMHAADLLISRAPPSYTASSVIIALFNAAIINFLPLSPLFHPFAPLLFLFVFWTSHSAFNWLGEWRFNREAAKRELGAQRFTRTVQSIAGKVLALFASGVNKINKRNPNSSGYFLSLWKGESHDVAVAKGWTSMALEAVGLNAVNVLFLASTFSGNSSSPVIWWSALALQGVVLIAMAAYHAFLYRKLQIIYQTEPNRRDTVAGFLIHLFWFLPYLLPLLLSSNFFTASLSLSVSMPLVAMLFAVLVHIFYDAWQMRAGAFENSMKKNVTQKISGKDLSLIITHAAGPSATKESLYLSAVFLVFLTINGAMSYLMSDVPSGVSSAIGIAAAFRDPIFGPIFWSIFSLISVSWLLMHSAGDLLDEDPDATVMDILSDFLGVDSLESVTRNWKLMWVGAFSLHTLAFAGVVFAAPFLAPLGLIPFLLGSTIIFGFIHIVAHVFGWNPLMNWIKRPEGRLLIRTPVEATSTFDMESKAMREGADRLFGLVKSISEDDVNGMINFVNEEVVSVSQITGTGTNQNPDSFIKNLPAWLKNEAFLELFNQKLATLRKGSPWTDKKQFLLTKALLEIGINKNGIDAVSSKLETDSTRVLFIDNEMHKKFGSETERLNYMKMALIRAGALEGKPIRIVAEQGILGFYQDLITEFKKAGFKGDIEVRSISANAREGFVNPAALQAATGLELSDMILIMSDGMTFEKVSKDSPLAKELRVLLGKMMTYDQLVPINTLNIGNIAERIRAVLIAA